MVEMTDSPSLTYPLTVMRSFQVLADCPDTGFRRGDEFITY